MNAVTLRNAEAKPYKGPESYQVEDAELFFGREREAEQLTARILSTRLTLLHAQSGAGKTSLLNARIIPGLETRGWGAFRVLPQNDPVSALRAATLRYLLPPPDAEAQAVRRALAALCGADEQPTLHELLARYDALKPRATERRALLAPLQTQLPNAAGTVTERGATTPYFCRLLRSSLELDTLTEHLEAVRSHGDGATPPLLLEEATPVHQLLAFLEADSLAAAYRNLIAELHVPVNDLAAFFTQLLEVYGRQRADFGLVVILDQFEELFTRFIDPGVASPELAAHLPSWRLRWEFFKQLETLYGQNTEQPQPTGLVLNFAKSGLPLRYVVSMRDEYIAQLDPLRRFVWDLDNNAYHLSLLSRAQAEEAIKKPAEEFGYGYAGDCYSQLIAQLMKEDRFVEPAHLQLVCEKLWSERGRELAKAADDTSGQIELQTFQHLGEVPGILRSFFNDYLERLNVAEQLETLEMLEALVTTSRTRNIVEREILVNVPFRDSARRERLLDNLINKTILRTERRLGGNFVEIVHEFLIGPILEALRDKLNADVQYKHLRGALRILESLYVNRALGTAPLQPDEFRLLHERRNEIAWNAWGAELMLRSAVKTGASKTTIAAWAARVDQPDAPSKPEGSGAIG